MNRQTSRQKVLAVYPNAIIVEDIACGKNIYDSIWANQCKFIIVTLDESLLKQKTKILRTTYAILMGYKDIECLSTWQTTKSAAWKTAWEIISRQTLKKFEQA